METSKVAAPKSGGKHCRVLMQFRTASMSAMLAITKHGVMLVQFHNGRHGGGPKLR